MPKIYTVFKNVNESILELNKYIKGYQFVKINLPEVKENFSQLVGIPNGFYSHEFIFNDNGQEIDKYFYDAILANKLADYDMFDRYYMIFLETLDNKTVMVDVNGKEYPTLDINFTYEYAQFLTQCLRLTFSGYVLAPVTFLINIETKEIPIRLYGQAGRQERKLLSIEESKFEQFNKLIKNELTINKELLLVLEHFNTSYTVEYDAVRFIILITALESIFNTSKDQISHTIARHSSLLISNTKEEFQNNYSRIKKLYSKRSNIVHGQKKDIYLEKEDINFTEELVKKSIIFYMNSKFNKQQLFDYCNRLGYPE